MTMPNEKSMYEKIMIFSLIFCNKKFFRHFFEIIWCNALVYVLHKMLFFPSHKVQCQEKNYVLCWCFHEKIFGNLTNFLFFLQIKKCREMWRSECTLLMIWFEIAFYWRATQWDKIREKKCNLEKLKKSRPKKTREIK